MFSIYCVKERDYSLKRIFSPHDFGDQILLHDNGQPWTTYEPTEKECIQLARQVFMNVNLGKYLFELNTQNNITTNTLFKKFLIPTFKDMLYCQEFGYIARHPYKDENKLSQQFTNYLKTQGHYTVRESGWSANQWTQLFTTYESNNKPALNNLFDNLTIHIEPIKKGLFPFKLDLSKITATSEYYNQANVEVLFHRPSEISSLAYGNTNTHLIIHHKHGNGAIIFVSDKQFVDRMVTDRHSYLQENNFPNIQIVGTKKTIKRKTGIPLERIDITKDNLNTIIPNEECGKRWHFVRCEDEFEVDGQPKQCTQVWYRHFDTKWKLFDIIDQHATYYDAPCCDTWFDNYTETMQSIFKKSKTLNECTEARDFSFSKINIITASKFQYNTYSTIDDAVKHQGHLLVIFLDTNSKDNRVVSFVKHYFGVMFHDHAIYTHKTLYVRENYYNINTHRVKTIAETRGKRSTAGFGWSGYKSTEKDTEITIPLSEYASLPRVETKTFSTHFGTYLSKTSPLDKMLSKTKDYFLERIVDIRLSSKDDTPLTQLFNLLLIVFQKRRRHFDFVTCWTLMQDYVVENPCCRLFVDGEFVEVKMPKFTTSIPLNDRLSVCVACALVKIFFRESIDYSEVGKLNTILEKIPVKDQLMMIMGNYLLDEKHLRHYIDNRIDNLFTCATKRINIQDRNGRLDIIDTNTELTLHYNSCVEVFCSDYIITKFKVKSTDRVTFYLSIFSLEQPVRYNIYRVCNKSLENNNYEIVKEFQTGGIKILDNMINIGDGTIFNEAIKISCGTIDDFYIVILSKMDDYLTDEIAVAKTQVEIQIL